MIKDIDGFKICKYIRSRGLNFPAIKLTAKIEDKDKIQRLTIGADDYITKPFNPLELAARAFGNLLKNEINYSYANTTILISVTENKNK